MRNKSIYSPSNYMNNLLDNCENLAKTVVELKNQKKIKLIPSMGSTLLREKDRSWNIALFC